MQAVVFNFSSLHHISRIQHAFRFIYLDQFKFQTEPKWQQGCAMNNEPKTKQAWRRLNTRVVLSRLHTLGNPSSMLHERKATELCQSVLQWCHFIIILIGMRSSSSSQIYRVGFKPLYSAYHYFQSYFAFLISCRNTLFYWC